jgi:hypothetical protein
MTRTFTTTDIVIYRGPGTPELIFAQDFSVSTAAGIAVYPEVQMHLDPAHLVRFWSMHDFTVWLAEKQAVVGRCWYEFIRGPHSTDERERNRTREGTGGIF